MIIAVLCCAMLCCAMVCYVYVVYLLCVCCAKGTVTGSITLDGQKLSQRKFSKMAGYVKQDDVLLNTATVRETLTFAVRLRCGHLSYEDQIARVDKVIDSICYHVDVVYEWIIPVHNKITLS